MLSHTKWFLYSSLRLTYVALYDYLYVTMLINMLTL